ncbi:insulin-like growth factor-binding protein complex acid labile subunit [Periplaneta americana]|uniref:insulin-like growth factor-binding protein complex acid labile subunit n=1 Tax=Periplaneta americana TaxID=6978 RepID=UPI0037E99E97
MRRRVAIMSTFLYTLLGLTVGASLHCSVRREISPCTCRVQEPRANAILVACERMVSFAQVVDALRDKFAPDTDISLRVAHSRLDDFANHTFQELGLAVTNLKLNHDNLSSLPESVFSGLARTEYLSLADNSLPVVPQHVLRQMPILKTLDIGRSRIQMITIADFQNMPDLQHLVLAGNDISQLEQSSMPNTLRHLHLGRNKLVHLNDTLRGLTDLEWLFLNGNQLTTLDGQLPLEGNKLALLHAGNNQLQKLPQELKSFILLESLFFQNNDLRNLGGTMQRARKLKRLHLYHNKIQELSSDEFLDLDSLEDLQLGHNKLTSLNGSLAPLRSLRCLNLTNNLLQEFSLQEIRGLRRLRIIDLSKNRISQLSGRMENLVEPETRIVELRLDHNLLRSLDGALMGVHGLQKLNLSSNLLEKIAPDDLIGLEDLRILDVSFNRLTTLEETSKTFLPSLEQLYASHNILTALKQDFHGLPVLCWADLSYNQIQTVERDLASKTRCRIHGLLGVLRIFLLGNPIHCNNQLMETIAAMEANYTKLHGIGHCQPINTGPTTAIVTASAA